ncbi:MAG TPA: gluconate 2-dehydrogenase subunit 3 family protein [Bryobacteraceae bacterium]|nr:gluconate 2-dehydrogenase subunit 3 family protein [Bryobacteraceae bacterium]
MRGEKRAQPTRREVMGAAALVAGRLAKAAPAPRQGESAFFTPEEFALVDELTEMIIPADEHSPGARAAQVAAYIDRRLAEALEAQPKEIWREGLRRVDDAAHTLHGGPFLKLTPEQRTEVLTRFSLRDPFFPELKARTANAYYTSRIGIHQEMEYKGNVYLEQFVGTDVGKADR